MIPHIRACPKNKVFTNGFREMMRNFKRRRWKVMNNLMKIEQSFAQVSCKYERGFEKVPVRRLREKVEMHS
jgi:hypothetical protein